jgi:hypothetical protein
LPSIDEGVSNERQTEMNSVEPIAKDKGLDREEQTICNEMKPSNR